MFHPSSFNPRVLPAKTIPPHALHAFCIPSSSPSTPSSAPSLFRYRLAKAPLSCQKGKLLRRADKGSSCRVTPSPQAGHRSLPHHALPDSESIKAGLWRQDLSANPGKIRTWKRPLTHQGLAGMSLVCVWMESLRADGAGTEEGRGGAGNKQRWEQSSSSRVGLPAYSRVVMLCAP